LLEHIETKIDYRSSFTSRRLYNLLLTFPYILGQTKSEGIRHSGHALMILLSNCLAWRHFLMQVKQKQWLQFGNIPNLCSREDFSIIVSKQTPQDFSLLRWMAKDNSISASCCFTHACIKIKISFLFQNIEYKSSCETTFYFTWIILYILISTKILSYKKYN